MTAPDDLARLRRELEEAFAIAREIGQERNELAEALGREVAATVRMKAMLVECANYFRAAGMQPMAMRCLDAMGETGNENEGDR